VQNQDVYSSTNDNNDDNNDNNTNDDDNDVQITPKEPPATPRSMARLANTNQHSFDAGAMADALLVLKSKYFFRNFCLFLLGFEGCVGLGSTSFFATQSCSH